MEVLMKKIKRPGLLAVITAMLVGLAAPAPAPVSAALQQTSRGALVSD